MKLAKIGDCIFEITKESVPKQLILWAAQEILYRATEYPSYHARFQWFFDARDMILDLDKEKTFEKYFTDTENLK